MRIMYGKNDVREIIQVEASPAWKPGESTEDNPSHYTVMFYEYVPKIAIENGINECDYVGNYILDGTKETYEKAKQNFESICEKLLTQGWCKDTDFENFEWWD